MDIISDTLSEAVGAIASKLGDRAHVVKADDGGLWLHIHALDVKGDREHLQTTGLTGNLLEKFLEWYPKATYQASSHASCNNNAMMILKAANLFIIDKPDDMIALRIFRSAGILITASIRPIQSIRDVQDQYVTRSPDCLDTLLTQIINRLHDHLKTTINDCIDRIDLLEDQLLDPSVTPSGSDLLSLRRIAIGLKRACLPQAAALEDYATTLANTNDPLKDRLYFLANSFVKMDELLAVARDHGGVIADALSLERSRNTEKMSWLLTLAAGIFLPINLLVGLFGVNVAGLPWTETENGFLILCLFLAGIGIGSALLSWFILKYLGRS